MNPIPSGLCQCGCGQETDLVRWNSAPQGRKAGEPYKYIRGHRARLQAKGPAWISEDRGYKTVCWIWQRTKSKNGYARTRRSGSRKILMAHRAIWEVEHGPVPNDRVLHHLCEQPSCVNPAHLKPITHAENIRKGKLTKLTMTKAREIRQVAAEYPPGRKPKKMLAERHGISIATIDNILKDRTWRES